jgi:hypothetical protein
MGERVRHFGRWLRRRVRFSGVNIGDFARNAGLAVSTIHEWCRSKMPEFRGGTFLKLATALKMAPEDLQAILDQATGEDEYMEPMVAPEIPAFDLPLSAGPWAEVTEVGYVADERARAMGVFGVRVHGESMWPAYVDGQWVAFRVLDWPMEEPAAGQDIYVQRDHAATFKTLREMDEQRLVLAAINTARYPGPIVVERAEIVRVGVAVTRRRG